MERNRKECNENDKNIGNLFKGLGIRYESLMKGFMEMFTSVCGMNHISWR